MASSGGIQWDLLKKALIDNDVDAIFFIEVSCAAFF